MSGTLESVFARLRGVLVQYASHFHVTQDCAEKYGLEAAIGTATLRAWKGKVRTPRIPVAWVEVRKTYVSYHLMGLPGSPELVSGISAELRRHMQGKACFNFKVLDESLMEELERITAQSLSVMRRAGYIADTPPE